MSLGNQKGDIESKNQKGDIVLYQKSRMSPYCIVFSPQPGYDSAIRETVPFVTGTCMHCDTPDCSVR